MNLNSILFKGVNRKKLSQQNIFSTILRMFLICLLLRQNVQNRGILRVDFGHYLNIFCQPSRRYYLRGQRSEMFTLGGL